MKTLIHFDSILSKKEIDKHIFLHEYSPIHFLSKISEVLGHPIYIKRDDLTGIGTGGNKLRKLEYLLAEAKQQKATRIITVGARQSNHARLTAFTAKMMGFEVDLVLKNSVPLDIESYQLSGNILLDNLVEANIHEIPNDDRVSTYIQNLIEQYESQGEKVYFIPVGGSNTIGGLGYTRAALEIEDQANDLGLEFNHIALATGSGGTHGGLIAGYSYLEKKCNIRAYNVQIDREPLISETLKISNEVLSILDSQKSITQEDIKVSNEYVGEAYGIPDEGCLETLRLLAQSEGIVLDPVYTGKAFNGFISDIKKGLFPEGEPLLFIHTGGVAGIYAYRDFIS